MCAFGWRTRVHMGVHHPYAHVRLKLRARLGNRWGRKQDASGQTVSEKHAEGRICHKLSSQRNAPASELYRQKLETYIDRMLRDTRTGNEDGQPRESAPMSMATPAFQFWLRVAYWRGTAAFAAVV